MIEPLDLERHVYGQHPSVQAVAIAEKLNELIKYLSGSQQAPSLSVTDSGSR